MTLTGPILDDRTYDQLKDELIRRIPAYTPEWTDHNESDPGVALLELFAYLGESLLYRFNQIPDATKVAFLNLLGMQPRPAQVAHTLLAATTERPAGVQILKGATAMAGSVGFETDDEVYVWPLSAVAVGKMEADDPGDDPAVREREKRRRQDAIARRAQTHGRPGPGTPRVYEVSVVPSDPAAGTTVDVSATVDHSLWIALLSEKPFDIGQLRGHVLFLAVAFDEQVPLTFSLTPRPPSGRSRRTAGDPPLAAGNLLGDTPGDDLTMGSPATLWELWMGPDPTGSPLTSVTVVDGTQGMTATGVAKLMVPESIPQLAQPYRTDGDLHSPPPLDDEKQAAQVIAWLRVSRPASENDAIHRIRWVGLNAVSATQARTASAELLGIGTAEPGQSFRLTQHPVIPGSVALEVEETAGWTPWQEVESLSLSGPLDRHYALDADGGVVHFGLRSRVPQIGQRVRVLSYRYGGGTAGNVPAGAIGSIVGAASVTVRNVLPAAGGSNPAALADALAELPARVHRRDRAVVAEDFRALSLEVPGVRRAESLPLFHPDTPTTPRAGVVSVVVFPVEDQRRPQAPLPEVDLLRRVATYLNPRRLATTELYVVPPTYRQVAVSVGVHVADGYQVDAVRRWVELLLRQYLAPLPPYGPSGGGWPLGRAVRRAELEAIAVQVDGVDYLEGDLGLAVRTSDPADPPLWQPTGLLELAPWEVPELAAITVVGGVPLPVGTGYRPPPDPTTDPVLVPLPPEVCG